MNPAPDAVAPPMHSATRLNRRAWPLAVTGAFVLTCMAYTLWWAPVVRHHPYWITPGDLWSTYRTAHYVGWGYLGGVYSAGTGLVTLPGIVVALAPMAMLTSALGLTEGFPKFVPEPTSWLLLGPYEMLLSAVALFACDAVAERLGVGRGHRAVLCVTEAAVLWNVTTVFGHPEDAVAVGLALYSVLLALDGRWAGAGWLFGAAVATQPLVIVMLPVLLALGGRRRAVGLVTRSALPGAALVLTPLLAQFHATVHALIDQPNYPRIDHATPWTALAPSLGGAGRSVAVAAGPGRVVAIVLACALGWWACRWRSRPELIVWAAAAALALRCVTESVMVAFYIWPALALGLVVAARGGRTRLTVACAAAIAATEISSSRLGELPWWLLVTAGIVAVLLTGVPKAAGAGLPGLAEAGSPLCTDSAPIPGHGAEHTAVLVGAVR